MVMMTNVDMFTSSTPEYITTNAHAPVVSDSQGKSYILCTQSLAHIILQLPPSVTVEERTKLPHTRSLRTEPNAQYPRIHQHVTRC
jgi:hypothetical protein